jgi:hypothetical protein
MGFLNDSLNSHVAEINDNTSSQVVYGLAPTTSATLMSNITAGVAYISGIRIEKAITSHTYTASKDTYLDIDNAGIYTFVAVANGAASPAITTNSIRIAKIVTNGTAITAVILYSRNTYFGYNTGTGNTYGSLNVAIGSEALETCGNTAYAVAIGYQAMRVNAPDGTPSSGMFNTAVGYYAMRLNTTGNHDTALGFSALAGNTTGSANTGIGEDALLANTTGGSNTALGAHSLYQATTASSNTGIGDMVLGNNTTGYSNTAIGASAGIATFSQVGSCTTDHDMTFIGYRANVDKSVNAGPFVNSTAIGSGAQVDESNIVQLGNTSVVKVRSHGDFEAQDIGDGFICKSPDGTRYRITVANGGTVSVGAA